ncbi:Peptidyl-prolyl cis-trans isomerase CWC27 like protein [Eufriesea mexicana]|uniref:Spliceosome-associated protein CWC27 homolog n=1 Tax=Eufriesea mexicana TaxID=516756 RepID=A0A310SCG4_9HYME|nr:Peptidyl-prolyl cis-trans isomerase CWC27 like protein [Eufriesea mexicana]
MKIIEEMENEEVELGNNKSSEYNSAVAYHGLDWANKANVKRIIKGFITQGGDSTGTGEGGKIYGEPFKAEFHTRLHVCRRDLIAMANAGKNKHTIFGKVTGESIYCMLKLEEALVDENDEPLCPPGLIKTIILNNPFSDIIPRIIVQALNLLSFGGEATEDEEESVILNKKFTGKGKSAHDHLTDPKLSSQPAAAPSRLANK